MRPGCIWRGLNQKLPPLGLGYLAAVVEREGFKVRILDLSVWGEGKIRRDLRKVFSRFPARFLGVTATTPEIGSALGVARIYREVHPQSRVVFGGAHPSVMAEELISDPGVDLVLRGEGEDSLPRLLKGENPARIPGVVGKNGEAKTEKIPAPEIVDLDNLPFPAYHLLPMKKYTPPLGGYRELPATSMLISRGCPYRCSFCAPESISRRVRFRSPRAIIEEIKLLQRDFGIREISFYDENFTLNPKQVEELCRRLMDQRIRLSWSCRTRVDLVDAEILGLIRKAGCHQIGYGIESGDEKTLEYLHKDFRLAEIHSALEKTRKAGLEIRASFILGTPGETEESLTRTLELSRHPAIGIAFYNILVPLPGTPIFREALARGDLLSRDFDDYDGSQALLKLPHLSPARAGAAYRQAYRKFYFRPRIWKDRFMRIRSLRDLMTVLRAGKNLCQM